MKNILVELMSNFIKLNADEKNSILHAFPVKIFEKGTNLLRQGQIAKDGFLVIKGCVRQYSMKENGDEITTDFYTEFQSANNYNSIANNSPSKYYLTCNEKTTVAIVNSKKETELYKKHPKFGEICRVEMEKMMGSNQEATSKFINSTPKERYLNVLKERPDLINRVAQYQLASYLGIKPETLSRIRKRISMEH